MAPWWFLSVFVLAIAGSFLMPIGPGFWIYNDLLVCAAVAAMAWDVRRPHAASLWLVVIGQALVIGGLLLITLMPTAPFPSPANVAFLVAYSVQIAGWAALVRQRLRGQRGQSLVDASVINCGFFLLSWVFMIEPAISDGYSSATADLGHRRTRRAARQPRRPGPLRREARRRDRSMVAS